MNTTSYKLRNIVAVVKSNNKGSAGRGETRKAYQLLT